MEVDISYDRRAVIQALRYHFLKKREIRLMMVLVNVFALLAAILYAMKLITPLPFLMSSVLWISMMAAFWLWLPHLIYRRSRTFRDRFRAVFEDRHLFLSTGKGGRTWAWREFSHFLESPAFFHLYFDSRTFLLIPKDGFEDPSLVGEARRMLLERIGGAKPSLT